MASLLSNHPFGAFINMEHSPCTTDPPAILRKVARPNPLYKANLTHRPPRDKPMRWTTPLGPAIIRVPRYLQTLQAPRPPFTPSGVQTPATPDKLEMSRPPSPRNDNATDVVQTLSNTPMNEYHLLSACFICFGNGLNDSAPGALTPYMEKDYHVGYAIVSLTSSPTQSASSALPPSHTPCKLG